MFVVCPLGYSGGVLATNRARETVLVAHGVLLVHSLTVSDSGEPLSWQERNDRIGTPLPSTGRWGKGDVGYPSMPRDASHDIAANIRSQHGPW